MASKTWWRENPDLYKALKQPERCAKWKKATEQQHDLVLTGFQYTGEMEVIVNNLMTNVDHEQPLKVINFDCDEAIDSEQQQQDVIADFDLSLLDV